MIRFALLAPLLVLGLDGAARADLPAIGVFRKAVKVQGALREKQVADVYLHINGHTVDKDGEHSFDREYWYRTKDRSLRVRTRSKANNRAQTDRGILGGKGYWEQTSRGKLIKLRRANRDDKEVIQTIQRDRREFERILHTVLLSRLDTKDTKFSFATKEPVSLLDDLPYSANSILGKDRRVNRYYVLDVRRPNEDPLRLFVHTKKFEVHKVIEFTEPDRIDWVYYFGPFMPDKDLGLRMPRYFSAHEGREPMTEEERKVTGRYRGEVKLRLNAKLATRDLFPGRLG